MALIAKACHPIFSDLKPYSEGYLSQIFKSSFSHLRRELQNSVTLRLETLSKFANRTKNRLQLIRKITLKTDLKKKDVLPTHVTQLLNQSPDPAQSLREDIEYIITPARIKPIIRCAFEQDFANAFQCNAYLYNESLKIYKKLLPDNQMIASLKPDKDFKETKQTAVDEAIKRIIRLENTYGSIKLQSNQFLKTPAFKLQSKLKNLTDLLVKFKATEQLLCNKDNDAIVMKTAVLIYYNGAKREFTDFITEIREKLKSTSDVLHNNMRVMQTEAEYKPFSKEFDALRAVLPAAPASHEEDAGFEY
jgi:hypothetical protein